MRIPAIDPILLLAAALIATACTKPVQTGYDTTLPERQIQIEAREPLATLMAAAENEEPDPRARAIALLLRSSPAGELRPLAERALWDPEPWVQRCAIESLGLRLPDTADLLESFLQRQDGLADPQAKAVAAALLLEQGRDLGELLRSGWRAERRPWRAAPLQLAAARVGDADAMEALAATLAEGELGLDPDFLLDIGRSGLAELIPALAQASEVAEPDIAIALLSSRLLLGDPDADKMLRQRITSGEELEVLEILDFLTPIDSPVSTRLIGKVKANSPLARRYADLALAARRGEPVLAFDLAIDSEDPELRSLVIRFATEGLSPATLAKRDERRLSRLLAEGLSDRDPIVRATTLRSATPFSELLSSEQIRPHLADEVIDVRIEAAGLLWQPGSP